MISKTCSRHYRVACPSLNLPLRARGSGFGFRACHIFCSSLRQLHCRLSVLWGTSCISSFHYTSLRFIRNSFLHIALNSACVFCTQINTFTITNSSAILTCSFHSITFHFSPTFRKILKVQRLHKLARLRHSFGSGLSWFFVHLIACLPTQPSPKQLSLTVQKHTPDTTCFQHICPPPSFVRLMCPEPHSYSQRRAAQRLQWTIAFAFSLRLLKALLPPAHFHERKEEDFSKALKKIRILFCMSWSLQYHIQHQKSSAYYRKHLQYISLYIVPNILRF
jgi:hypothetical protein